MDVNHIHRIIILVYGLSIRGYAVGTSEVDCESMEITKCLQSTTQNQLFFPDTPQKLREYCKHLMAGLDCSRNIIENCVSVAERELYHNLTRDMVGMNVALCTPGSPLSTRFLKHVDCFKHISEHFRSCSERHLGNIVVSRSLAQEEQVRMTCCTVHDYTRCMRKAVEGRCDEDAQKLIEETVITALNQSMGYCKQLGDIPTSDCMKKFSPSNSHETSNLNIGNDSGHLLASISELLIGVLLVLLWS